MKRKNEELRSAVLRVTSKAKAKQDVSDYPRLINNLRDLQEKVARELEDIFQGEERNITMKDLGEMKYLERVIKESLRLYPSVPFIARLLDEDLEFGK